MDLSSLLRSARTRARGIRPEYWLCALGLTAGTLLVAANATQPRLVALLPKGVLIGIYIGSIYALIALGYTMVYGILKFINFAHGDVFMWGGYFVYVFSVMAGVNFYIACFVAVMLTSLMGVVIEKIGYRPLRHAPRLAPLITAIGISLFLEAASLFFFKANNRSISQQIGGVDVLVQKITIYLPGPVILFGAVALIMFLLYSAIRLTGLRHAPRMESDTGWKARLRRIAAMSERAVLVLLMVFLIAFVIAMMNDSHGRTWAEVSSAPVILSIEIIDAAFVLSAIIVMLLLHLLVTYSRLGKAMRAVSDDMESASAVGIDVDRIIASTFAIGSLVAGVGGIMYGLKYGIQPYMGFLPGLKAFAAAVVGGIGSIYGAMIGGLIIGLAENVGPLGLDMVGIPGTPYQDAIAFIILIVVLIVQPSGIMGKEHLVFSRAK